MMFQFIKNIINILLLVCLYSQVLYADNQHHGALLGGGGTNYSKRKPDHNGLLTGINSSIHHLVGFYVDGAYTQMVHLRHDIASQPLGYAFGAGLLYEYQHFYLKVQTGVGVKVQNTDASVRDFTIIDNDVVDAMGYKYSLHYDFKQRKDHAKYLHLQVPIMVGTACENFYALAGFKFNMILDTDNQISAICSTSAKYDSFLGVFDEMDNHGLRKDVPINSIGHLPPFRFDALASLECGAEFSPQHFGDTDYRMYSKYDRLSYRFRVALFCDVGMISMFSRNSYNIVDIPKDYKWDFKKFKMNHIITSNKMTNVPLHNLYVGLKVTLFLDINMGGECRICGDYQTEADMNGF